jgi:G protein-coupled receptor GPR1
MAPYMLGNWTPPQFNTSSTAHIMLEKLRRQAQNTDQSRSTPPDHGHVILIVAVTSATISLIAALASFRWFAIMKRSFRQHLIMLLMLSDCFKALWFLIFPLTIFTHGRVNSASRFCQVGGFCIALAIEASDFATLMIAIHLALCIFGPQKPRGESGLWGYRRWIYPLWVALPILAASLAFTNPGNAYVAVETFCYLPNQPLWYRLALSWIPRLIIFLTLFSVGSTITVHVHLKFKRFSLLGGETSSAWEASRQPAMEDQSSQSISSPLRSAPATPQRSLAHIWQHVVPQDHYRGQRHSSGHEPEFSSLAVNSWVPLTRTSTRLSDGIGPADIGSAPASRVPSQSMISPQPPSHESSPCASRKLSRVSFAPHHHQNSIASSSLRTDTGTEELDTSRNAIEQHLRLLFIFPVAYAAVWAVPFISQCLQYTDKYALNQPHWLSITVTAILALQAGVDAVVFTLREQSWKRRRGNPLISVDKLRKMMLWSQSTKDEKGKMPATVSADGSVDKAVGSEQSLARTTVHWWEEVGKRRRDSVWMGTDKPYILKSCQEAEDETDVEREDVQRDGDGERENKNSKGQGVTTQTFDHGMVYVKPLN